jgi:hypothetical protein
MQNTIQKSTSLSIKLSLLVALALLTRQTDAQVVPYRVTGTGIGSLLDLSATGEGVGLHLGRMTFEVNDEGTVTQFAADGSTLELQRVQVLFQEISDPDPETGQVVLTFIEELQIMGGTKRFRNVQPAPGNLISTVVSEPFDPVGDVTAIPFAFQVLGQIDLGRRN